MTNMEEERPDISMCNSLIYVFLYNAFVLYSMLLRTNPTRLLCNTAIVETSLYITTLKVVNKLVN